MQRNVIKLINFIKQNERFILYLSVFLITVTGLFYSISHGDHLKYNDEREYYEIANNLFTKGLYSIDGIHLTAIYPPGYPFVLQLILNLGAEVWLLRFFNFILLSGCVVLLYNLLKRKYRFAGISGVLLIFYYPVLFYTAGTLYSQILGAFLFLLFINLIFSERSYYSFPAGLILGFLILVIPSFVFVALLTAGFMFIYRFRSSVIALVAASTVIVISMWTFRNYQVFNSFVFVSTNSGWNLLLGNSENTTANSGTNADLSSYVSKTAGMNEIERDTYYRSEAFNYIMENPSKAAGLYLRKVINYFNYRNDLATRSEEAAWKDMLMLLTYGPLLILFILRICFMKRFPLTKVEKYFVSVYLLNALFQAIFFTRIRFRLPFDFLLIGCVASFISNILENYIRADSKYIDTSDLVIQ